MSPSADRFDSAMAFKARREQHILKLHEQARETEALPPSAFLDPSLMERFVDSIPEEDRRWDGDRLRAVWCEQLGKWIVWVPAEGHPGYYHLVESETEPA